MKIHKYALEIAVFACGAIVMIFELAGSRVLAPYFGTSIFVWTSLIGIILGSLSLGYYMGGKISDKNPSMRILAMIIFMSAICIGLTIFIKDLLLIYLQANDMGMRSSSAIASLVLFMPASVLLGMVSPYAAKLKLDNLDVSGATIGNLYAISTAGSIFGTFFSGFYLIPTFGTNKLLVMLTVSLIFVSAFLSLKDLIKFKLFILLFMVISWTSFDKSVQMAQEKGFVDVDTSYNRIWIYDKYDEKAGDTVRTFFINNEYSSAMFLNKDDLVYDYTRYYNLASHFKPGLEKTLMLGGAGYSYPKEFLRRYPESTIDVVEIDPMITELAKKYFKLKDDPRMTIYHEDGRAYLNKTQKKYDVIFGDAFSSHHSLPYQLTTKEAVQKSFDILEDDGVVILNIISSIEGRKGMFLRAEYATYRSIFPQVYLFPVRNQEDGNEVQNIMMVALKADKQYNFESTDTELDGFLDNKWNNKVEMDMPVLTDDFAPVDQYISKTI